MRKILRNSLHQHATTSFPKRALANGKALGAYVDLSPTLSGGTEREQGTGRSGNARLRTNMVELAWMCLRCQPGSAIVSWFRRRLSGAALRLRRVAVVALARRFLIGCGGSQPSALFSRGLPSSHQPET